MRAPLTNPAASRPLPKSIESQEQFVERLESRLLPWPYLLLLASLILAASVCLVAATHWLHWLPWIGIPLLLVMAVWVHELAVHRRREMLQSARYMAALESLAEISAAISGKLGGGHQVMEQLAESSRQLLRMSRSGVALADESAGRGEPGAIPNVFKVFAYAGDVGPDVRRHFVMAELPVTRRCFETGEILMEGDTRTLKGANSAALREFNAASVIMIPLRVEGRWTGLMALADSRPRRFTAADRRLARLLAGQAAVILANNRLYEQARVMLNIREKLIEQTRRDAQTKALLLREVHHRVKNNLSGIIALLSMRGGIELPEAANQWLFRVIERIGNMARAHDLFSTVSERVELSKLIEQVLPSLSVIKPHGVEVRSDVNPADRITLPTTQAVSLAMVLHELASNAIQHGLAGRDYGHITIRASRTPRGTATIEVSDDGVGVPAGAFDPARGGPSSDGLGLQLVSELVKRELRGSFSLTSQVGSGAVATLEFPLQPFQESQGA